MDTPSDLDADSSPASRETILRDDQADFPSLLDIAKACRRAGSRLKLIDSGKLTAFELEWLGNAGADLLTSDQARQALADFVLMAAATKKGDSLTHYLQHGPFAAEATNKAVSFAALKDMGLNGIYLYASNLRFEREPGDLAELSFACTRGRCGLVYYLHGPLDPSLEALSREGITIHVSAQSLSGEEDVVLFCDSARAARKAGSNLILHVERPLEVSWLADIFDADAFVLFQTPPSDYRSPWRSFEVMAKRRKLDPAAYYLDPSFML
jgi:hypothetical protein